MLADDIAAALPELRAHAESLMQDTCIVDRPDGTTTQDPVTLEEVPNYAPVWSGPCRVQRSGSLSPSNQSPGGYEFGVGSVLAQMPISSTGIRRGDRFRLGELGPLSDPNLADLTATVQADLSKSHATKRTLVCEEVSP